VLLTPFGIAYSVWRRSKRSKACPACGAKPVPLATPEGQRLARVNYPAGLPAIAVTLPPPAKTSPIIVAGLVLLVGTMLYLQFFAAR
ncbi:MAG: hypothetical protein ABIW96_03195, partial [Polaromonas sp.]